MTPRYASGQARAAGSRFPPRRVTSDLDVLCDACGHRVSSKGLDAHFKTYCPKRAQQPPPTEEEQVRHALDVAEGIRNRR